MVRRNISAAQEGVKAVSAAKPLGSFSISRC